jgi:hypothetical protein
VAAAVPRRRQRRESQLAQRSPSERAVFWGGKALYALYMHALPLLYSQHSGVRLLAPDLTTDEIVAELHRLKGAALLGPFRSKPARDVQAIAQAVSALGRFMLSHPEVRELDVNPLLAFAEGEGVLALDALMSCD